MTLLVFSVVFALGLSAICSLLEATLLSYTPSQVAALQAHRPRLGAIWDRFKGHIEKPISVILVINTAAHTIGATMAGAQFKTTFGENGLIIFSILFTYLMLQFTEILPKSLGVRYNYIVAPVMAPPLALAIRVLAPVLWFIHLVNRPFERKHERTENTLDEISALAAMARLSELIDSQQERIIRAAGRLEELRVRQLMTPRTDVAALLVGESVGDIARTVNERPYTRFPLCDGDIDHIVGMVHIKDLFVRHPDQAPLPGTITGGATTTVPESMDLMKLRREILVFPDQLSALEALQRFQRARLHLAVVVDEYGATAGIVTLEDVIEELIGDVEDEFARKAPPLIHANDDHWIASGRMPLHELNEHLPGFRADMDTLGVDTLGGYVVAAVGRIPHKGDAVEMGRYTVTVTSVDERRVKEVRVDQKPEEGEETESEEASE
jgi:putative hemolysin